jgi:predicted transposase/invertase (TIGR01784 family)
MKTDTLFYDLFLTLPETLFQLLNLPEKLSESYNFLSQELKQLAKRIDGVFVPQENNLPIYFVEVQFQEDENLYYRLFTEIFTYLGQYKPTQNFQAVVIWGERSLDLPLPCYYQDFYQQGKLTIIHLDELEYNQSQGIGLGIINLVVANQTEAKQQVNNLYEVVNQQQLSKTKEKEILELIDKMLVYKFPNYTREELEKMFNLTDFKKTRFYQDTITEGKLESVPSLLKLGLSLEQIATALNLDLELVKKAAQ